MAKVKVKIKELEAKALSMLTELGVPEEDAKIATANMMEAEICGPESHGFTRLPFYAERISKGLIQAEPDIRIEAKGPCILRVDGGNGLGHVVTMRALEKSMEIAKETGCCMTFIKNSNHFGTCGFFSRLAVKEGLVAFVTSNASKSMPPYGAEDNILGTNPISFSFPAGKYDNFTIDIALSAVAKGKIRLYEKMGREIPLGWAMDSDGDDTTDPMAAIAGGMLPMGGHKGYGIAMAVDALCGLMTGARLSQNIESLFDSTCVSELGHAMVLIDPSRLVPMEEFVARAEKWFDDIKACALRKGFDEVLIPGELENRLASAAGEEIEILDKTARALGLI